MKSTVSGAAEWVSRTAAILLVSMGRMGNERTVRREVETPAGARWVRVRERHLECKELAATKNLQTEVRRFVAAHALPCGVPELRSAYPIPSALIDCVDSQLESYREKMVHLVARFVAAYPQRLAEARATLGDRFDLRGYVPEGEVAQRFHLEYRWVCLQVPETLPPALRRKAAQATDRESAAMLREARRGLRMEVHSLVHHVCQVLEDGKVVKRAAFANLREFTRLYPPKNDVVCDDALAGLVERSAKLAGGADLKTMRRDDTVRRHVARKFGEIEAELASMLDTESSSTMG